MNDTLKGIIWLNTEELYKDKAGMTEWIAG